MMQRFPVEAGFFGEQRRMHFDAGAHSCTLSQLTTPVNVQWHRLRLDARALIEICLLCAGCSMLSYASTFATSKGLQTPLR